MLSAEETLTLFGRAMCIPNYPVADAESVEPDIDESLFAKIERRLKKVAGRYPINFLRFNYVRVYEVGHLTGNELLRCMTSVLRNREVYRTGNCILFSIEDKYKFALLVFKGKWVEIITPPVEVDQHRYFFYKLFDDEAFKSFDFKCEEVHKLRECLPEKFTAFMHQPVSQNVSCPYTSSFLGVFKDISLFCVDEKWDKPGATNEIKASLLACLKLAIDSDQAGKIQNVLLYKSPDFESFKDDIVSAFVETHQREPTRPEMIRLIREKRAQCRMEEIKSIICKALHQNENGMFTEEEVKRVIQETKEFYEL
ncbi:unnamed protein product [Clavelina lepadiformis]|uniref:Uncharacterized protein n=1 Tax=Clavelina lepadiformis TaxID=159417 RepID=A0ABP0EXF5_CLALP